MRMTARARALAATGTALGLAVVTLLVFLILELRRASDQIEYLDSTGAARDRAIAALASGDAQLRAQVTSLGGTPKVPPPQVIISGAAGATGAQGPGPSDAQVQAAVDTYLAAHPPSGTVPAAQVEADVAGYLSLHPPASGRDASAAQIDASVAAYMAAHPAPSGPPGQDGQDGKQGNPGVNGAPGSPPAGWTWTDASGVTYDCVQDDQTPAPHYTCPARPSPSASPSPSDSPTATLSPPPPSPSTPGTSGTVPTSAAALLPPTRAPSPSPGSGLWPLQVVPLPRRQP